MVSKKICKDIVIYPVSLSHIFIFLIFCLCYLIILSAQVYSLNATGSQYVIGELSINTVSSNINSTIYSGKASSLSDAITNDAQGLTTAAVIGVSGNAVLTQNKSPIINSYSLTPSSVNQSSPVRIYVSAVYTSSVTVDITRPDNVVDTINMGSQSIYYYPYTNLVGRYDVQFKAQGNSLVTANSNFDVIEPVSAPPSDDDDTPRRTTSVSNDYVPLEEMYVSVSMYCEDNPSITVEVNDIYDLPIAGALVILDSIINQDNTSEFNISEVVSIISLNSSTDRYGFTIFNVVPGNYTLKAHKSGYDSVKHDYELYCPNLLMLENDTADINDSMLDISGNAISENNSNATSGKDSDTEVIKMMSRQSFSITVMLFIMVFITFVSMTLMILLLLVMVLQKNNVFKTGFLEKFSFKPSGMRRDTSDTSKAFNKRLLDTKSVPVNFGLYADVREKSSANKALAPVEEAIISVEKEILTNNACNIHKSDVVIVKDIKPEKTLTTQSIASPKPIIQILEKQAKSEELMKSNEQSNEQMDIMKSQSTPTITRELHESLKVPPGQEFILCNGQKLDSVNELAIILESMSDEVFNYHVTPYKNDFATWIYHAVDNPTLAERIGPIKSRREMVEMFRKGF